MAMPTATSHMSAVVDLVLEWFKANRDKIFPHGCVPLTLLRPQPPVYMLWAHCTALRLTSYFSNLVPPRAKFQGLPSLLSGDRGESNTCWLQLICPFDVFRNSYCYSHYPMVNTYTASQH